jgi:Flp pilus assembly pilin Flp
MSMKRTIQSLRKCKRGAVLVEYSLVLVAVGLPAVAGISAGGYSMYQQYKTCRSAMVQSSP